MMNPCSRENQIWASRPHCPVVQPVGEPHQVIELCLVSSGSRGMGVDPWVLHLERIFLFGVRNMEGRGFQPEESHIENGKILGVLINRIIRTIRV